MVQRKSRVKPKPKAQPESEYDSPWKDILEIYFEDFLLFFFPDIHSAIDWTQPIEFLNKELKQVTRDAVVGRRYADTLAKVYRLNGQVSYLYIHVEIQSQSEANFPERIFYYNTRLCEKYNSIVESLVVFGDDNPNWRPNLYSIQGIGITKTFTFPFVKLLDYIQKWSELEASRNPFATVVMVHLRTLETTNNRLARKVYKLALIKRLYEQGFSREDIINLYALIDWMMTLSKDLEREFQQELKQYEGEKKMPYITSIERAGQLEGEQRGELKGEQKVIIRLLNQRVGEIQPPLIEQIRKLSVEQLEELTDVLLTFSTVANLEQWLQRKLKPVEQE
jgi:predicted transposase YdaD